MSDLMRWDPFRELTQMRDTMDRLFERGFNRPWRMLTWDFGEGFFPVDVYETDEDVVVKASLPGVKQEDVHISVTGDTLTIKGETREEREEEQPQLLPPGAALRRGPALAHAAGPRRRRQGRRHVRERRAQPAPAQGARGPGEDDRGQGQGRHRGQDIVIVS